MSVVYGFPLPITALEVQNTPHFCVIVKVHNKIQGVDTIDITLIPFGLSEETNQLLDVFEVARGKKCGCICPSCKTPLIARQGSEKQWHFAHACKTVYTKTQKECEYSFFVSVRLMALQIIKGSLRLKLPEKIGMVEKYILEYKKKVSVPYSIVLQQDVELSNVEVEKIFMNIPVDILGHIKEYSFILYFTYPNRKIPEKLYTPSDKKCGILAISLDQTHSLFTKASLKNMSYQEILCDFLENDLISKKWIFHPRQEYQKKLAKKQLDEEVRVFYKDHAALIKNIDETSGTINPQEIYQPKFVQLENKIINTDIKRKLANFECINCQTQWQGLEPSGSPCPKCNTHLYRRFMGFVSKKD